MKIFEQAEAKLKEKGFDFERKDLDRPWGGFWVINSNQQDKFIEEYFSGISLEIDDSPISPKIIMVAPNKKLSWQYHNRRSEVWRILEGEVGIIRSKTDEQGDLQTFVEGDAIHLFKGERHRLIGLRNWGMIAEIWVHSDRMNLSNEEDIVRLQDDYGR